MPFRITKDRFTFLGIVVTKSTIHRAGTNFKETSVSVLADSHDQLLYFFLY